MRTCVKIVAAMTISMVVIAVPAIWSCWVQDGVPLCTATGDQEYPVITSDGAGGAIVTWSDYRSGGDYDIYAQRVSASGAVQWVANGVALCTAVDNQTNPQIVSDGAGGAIVAWADYRSGGDYDIYAQRVSASGAVQWVANGVALCTAGWDQDDPTITSDGAGGAIVTWTDYRSGSDYHIYAQRVNASGVIQWAADGVGLSTASGSQYNPSIASDGAGGAIVTWHDTRSGGADIYAQRVSAWGAVQWVANGVALCTASEPQYDPTITSDGAGGAIVTWTDYRSGSDYDIYAQRVNASGAVQWTGNGVALCTASADQSNPTIASDGGAGAIVTWSDYRSGGDYDIYAQRVNASGAVQWTGNGVALCTASESQTFPTITSDGAGGAVVIWQDSWDFDIYAQKVNASGAVQWTADGVPLCTPVGAQYVSAITSDGAGGAIATWDDSRGGDFDIYAQFIDGFGRVGFLSPEISAIRDVPGDQGGKVYLSWYAARSDVFMDSQMSHYSIWRAISATQAAMGVDGGTSVLESLSELDTASGKPAIRVEQAGGLTYFWELVEMVDALYMEAYGRPVATLFDSTSVCTEYHYFQVVAHTTDPKVFWKSDPDSGYSVDNLAPCAPTALAAEYIGGFQLYLHWNPNAEPDLHHYAIYKGTRPDFVPDEGNCVGTATDSSFVDDDFGYNEYYYKLSAIDIHENESPFSLLTPDMISGTPGGDRNYVNALFQNSPNPFRYSTRIAFTTKEEGHVRLTVFDAKGRLVRVLTDEARPANHFVESWDGKDRTGRPVPAGMYFYRLEVPGWSASKKMTLAR